MRVGLLFLVGLVPTAGTTLVRTSDPTPTPACINVRHAPYNAVGDGSADDTVALNAALRQASFLESRSNHSSLSCVFVPRGRYRVTAPLELQSVNAVQVLGTGGQAPEGSTIVRDFSLGTPTLIINASQFVRVSALAFTDAAEHPSAGAAVLIEASYHVRLDTAVVSHAFAAVVVNASNTVTVTDCLFQNIYGLAAVDIGAVPGQRVDIVQLQRITTNNLPSLNRTVWIHMGQATNTLRLDNVGLINGGTAVRMDCDFPVGVATSGDDCQMPLFIFANDLEIDFPHSDAIQLVEGRVVELVNSYVQGSVTGAGIHVFASWTAEFQLSNWARVVRAGSRRWAHLPGHGQHFFGQRTAQRFGQCNRHWCRCVILCHCQQPLRRRSAVGAQRKTKHPLCAFCCCRLKAGLRHSRSPGRLVGFCHPRQPLPGQHARRHPRRVFFNKRHRR
eukprot:m.70480 g.70480  ORF g.70480 m.70480 type:complete len:446 (-) comp14070_c0_seq2:1132-2469(-)